MSQNQEGYSVPAIRDNPVPMMALSLDEAKVQLREIQQFIKGIMVEGTDYGVIPGTKKPTLLQSGAHKLINIFAFDVDTVLIDSEEDWDRPFFYYRYRTELRYKGRVVGVCEGSCNSMEARYRWRWVPEHKLPAGTDKGTLTTQGGKLSEFGFAVDKAETGGKYGKPADYWQKFKDAIEAGTARKFQKKTRAGKEYDAWEIDGTVYRVLNDDIPSIVNTVQKLGQKRSVVGATIMATRTGDKFTQDIEDGGIVEGDYREVPVTEKDKQKKTNGKRPSRPWAAEELKRVILHNVTEKGWDEPASPKQVGLLAGKLDEVWAGDKGATDNRHELTGYIFGKRSAKELTKGEASVLLDWLLDKADSTGDQPFKAHAREEANLVLRQAMLDQGQGELDIPLEDEKAEQPELAMG